MRLLLGLLLAVSGCGTPPGVSQPRYYASQYAPEQWETEKQGLYLSLAPQVQDSAGFIETDHCDSLLYTSLLGAAGVPVRDIEAAENAPGEWVRRPEALYEPCYPGNSRSSNSRDMVMGLMWYLYMTGDLQNAEELSRYEKSHDGNIGIGEKSRIGLRIPLRSTLSKLQDILGGDGRRLDQTFGDPLLDDVDGYEAHLRMLHLALRGELWGYLSKRSLNAIRDLADQNPESPLANALASRWVSSSYVEKYRAASGNTQYWPGDRLPTSADRCTGWLYARDDSDWLPCAQENRTHSGGDWLFAYMIMYRPVPN